MVELSQKVTAAYADRELLKKLDYVEAVRTTIAMLDSGKLRVAEKTAQGWQVNAWIKEAILLYFAISEMRVMEAGPFEFYDKLPLKKGLEAAGVRVVPPGTVRYGAFVEKGAVIMPGYVNIGARVGSGSMVDTWATVGSCAQVGRNVHLSGGVGLGGVLEPPSSSPVIVEDAAPERGCGFACWARGFTRGAAPPRASRPPIGWLLATGGWRGNSARAREAGGPPDWCLAC